MDITKYTEEELIEQIQFLKEEEIKLNTQRRMFQAELKYRLEQEKKKDDEYVEWLEDKLNQMKED